MIMGKKAVSVTLNTDNLTWLRARTVAEKMRSMSELLDQLIAQARADGPAASVRSVIGTIDVDPLDPFLEHADEAVQADFERSLGRSLSGISKEGRKRAARAARKSVNRKRG